MARRARLSVSGGVFHVVSRFLRDEWRLDVPGARAAYLEYLGEASVVGGVEVLAYCLMSNHVHLVVVQGSRPLERFMKSVHSGFAAWSRAHGRGRRAQGPVFAERPRTVLVDKDAYLLQLVRYVHNNPVRAGLVRFARRSTWSSHQAYIGEVSAPEWLRTGYVLDRFGGGGARALASFDAFVDEGRKEARRPELSGVVNRAELVAVRRELGDGHRVSDGIVGGARFVAKVSKDVARVQKALSSRGDERRAGRVARPTVRELIDAVALHLRVDVRQLTIRPKSRASAAVKRLAIWTWVHEYAGDQIEVARALSLDTGMTSRYYGQASAASGDFDQEASAVVALIRKHGRKRAKTATPATADAVTVRYHVDVAET